MADILQCILCEKPSAAKNYANALGGFKGEYNGKKYEIVNSVGHIFEYLAPDMQVDESVREKYSRWSTENLPWQPEDLHWKRKLGDGFTKTYNQIKECMDRADEIVIATDDDPTGEGTLLADEIIIAAAPKGKHYYRSFHTDESIKEIQKAMSNLTDLEGNPLKDPDFIKADFRSKWDYLSIQWTRMFTKLGDGKSVLRQGRLKSYMVWAVGNQIKLAQGYEKIPYYDRRFKDENGNTYISKSEKQYEKKELVPDGLEDSPVIKDGEEKKHTSPPALYDLNMLASSLAPQGFKAKEVLDVYQKMYEDRNSLGEGIVSYPRTEDKNITPEQFADFLKIAPKIAAVAGVDPKLLTHTRPRSTHVAASGTHGANRPSGNVPASLDELEKKHGKCGRVIYEFLARNSLAMLCEDYEYIHETGHLEKYPEFKGYSNIPVKQGFKTIFNDDKKKEEDDTGLPLGKNASPFIHEGFPPKPSWPTAKWLAKELKKNDVGTGATRTSIYADVTNASSKYPLLTETKGKLNMTVYGEMSYVLLKDTHIGDVKLTENLQQQMRDVSKGKNPVEYLSEIEGMIRDDIETVRKNAASEEFRKLLKKGNSESHEMTCPVCGRKFLKGKNGYYCSGIFDKNCDFGIYRTVAGKELTDEQIASLVENGKTEVIKGFKSRAGNEFDAALKISEDHKVVFEFYRDGLAVPKEMVCRDRGR